MSDGNGRVRFDTIYPGWYPGRAVHIHAKVRRAHSSGRGGYDFTTQLFFDEATNERVMAMPPYNRHSGRRTTNARDGIYGDATSLVVATTPRSGAAGLTATISLGLDLA